LDQMFGSICSLFYTLLTYLYISDMFTPPQVCVFQSVISVHSHISKLLIHVSQYLYCLCVIYFLIAYFILIFIANFTYNHLFWQNPTDVEQRHGRVSRPRGICWTNRTRRWERVETCCTCSYPISQLCEY